MARLGSWLTSLAGVCAGVLLAVSASGGPVFAAVGATQLPSVELQALTSPEVAAAIADGVTAVIVPTGGIEQNGPHMALGKHNLIIAETARRIALELGGTLVAPVIAYTPQGDIAARAGHMAHAGTISIPDPVFAGVLEATARSLAAHGFRAILFIGDSGPNQKVQEQVAANLDRKLGDETVRVISVADYYAANGGEEALAQQGFSPEQVGRHAGLRDTSELMAVAPGLVHLDRAQAGAAGVDGDPRGANAATGETLLALKVTAAVKEIRRRLTETSPARAPEATAGNGILGWLSRLLSG